MGFFVKSLSKLQSIRAGVFSRQPLVIERFEIKVSDKRSCQNESDSKKENNKQSKHIFHQIKVLRLIKKSHLTGDFKG